MIRYKIDILKALKDKGYSTYRLRKEKILGEATLQKFRKHELPSWKEADTLCHLLNCQLGDLLEYTEGEEDEKSKSI